MKVILQDGKYCTAVFADTDKGWLAFFSYMDDDMDYYHSLKCKDALKELEENLKEERIIREKTASLPEKLRNVVKERCADKVDELEEEIKELTRQRELYKKAVKGDVVAIKALAGCRKRYEYEGWEIKEVDGM